jgi:hypothetical protein
MFCHYRQHILVLTLGYIVVVCVSCVVGENRGVKRGLGVETRDGMGLWFLFSRQVLGIWCSFV